MNLKMLSKAKRAPLAVFASAVAVTASLTVLPAAPASAADAACQSFSPGGVTFSLCAERVNSTRGRARIIVQSGTYVSGTLYLLGPGDNAYGGCSGRIYPGNDCHFSEAWGSGIYEAEWDAADGSIYTSGGLLVN